MHLERPELRLVREKLESVLSPELASSVLFEALAESGGRPPASVEGIVALVQGSLRHALARRLLPSEAKVVVDELAASLASVATAPKLTGRELAATLEVPRDKGAVTVLVIAGSDEFAARLEAALGPARVATRTATTLREVEALTAPSRASSIVLVDAMEFPPIEPLALVGLLGSLPASTVRAIWGADVAYGSVVLSELIARALPATPLDRREGIEPLLDLVRSRRG